MPTVRLMFWIMVGFLGVSALMLAYSRNWSPDKVALEAVATSPTFRCDGVENSLKVLNVSKIEEDVWLVKVEFTCRNAGYGDRTGRIVLPVITTHVAEVKVISGIVVEIIVDGVWDELNQRPVLKQ